MTRKVDLKWLLLNKIRLAGGVLPVEAATLIGVEAVRIQSCLEDMLREGIIVLDDATTPRTYRDAHPPEPRPMNAGIGFTPSVEPRQ
jgi:hypothetical protein